MTVAETRLRQSRFPTQSSQPLEIAIIGTGIAGMSAAWLLDQAHTVTVYERDDRIGGHSNTVSVPGPEGEVPVDTGFIVYNEKNYPNLVNLFRYLEVPTRESEMSFAVCLDDGDLEYSGTSLNGLFGQRRNLIRPRFWRMVADLLRFYREAPEVLADPASQSLTLGQYLDKHRYSDAFLYDHLLPMAAAIWSTPVEEMREHPVRAFVAFCETHGLLKLAGRPQWRTVAGGSREYVQRLTHPYADRIIRGRGVRSVTRRDGGVIVTDATGREARFDHVVIATHGDQAMTMLADPTPQERHVLGAFKYQQNHAVLHRDTSLMPRRRGVWSSWNYIGRTGGDPDLCVTYWMNRLQSIDPRTPLFVTLNPIRPPRDETVVQSFTYDHPVFDLAAIAAQQDLWTIQGHRNIWFCGSYFGAGFHEDALQSGLAVAEAIGGVERPWGVPDGPARIPMPFDRQAA